MKKTLLTFIAFGFAFSAYSRETHSTLNIEEKTDKKGITTLTFKIIPNKGMAINFSDATPWTLELKGAKGVKLKDTKLGKEEYQKEVPGFIAQIPPHPRGPWSVDYRNVVFVCTADKSRCFRDVHKGTYQGSKKPPAVKASH